MTQQSTDTQGERKGMALAVVGVGCMFPDAANLKEYWANIVQGKDSIGPVPVSHWRPDDYFDADPKRPDHTYGRTGGFLKPYAFDPLQFGIAPHAIEATDATQLLGMVCAHEALVDAGYGPGREFNRERTSCILGVTGTLELVIPLGARLGHPHWKRALKKAGVADDVAAEVMAEIADSYVPWQENSFPGLLGNVVAGRIASRLDLGGSNAVVDAACASSLAALHMAAMELESGRSDMVITGGMDTFNDIFMYMCFSKTPALSKAGHARPFDAEGDGTILGEGLGAVILKRLEDAERDGDRIYAVVRGVGSGSDGKGQAIYAPAAKGQVKALSRAYAIAGVPTETIGVLEAHGTGTKVGDGVELDALAEVYGESSRKSSVIGSVKSQIGHTKAAAGVAGLIKCVMALHHKIQPPTLKVSALHPRLAATPFKVLDKARPWIPEGDFPRRAGVSAFGFGGSNYHCVLEEYKADDKPVNWRDEDYLFAWSAGDKEALGAAVQATIASIAGLENAAVQILARQTRRAFDREAAARLTVWAGSFEELQKRLAAAQELLAQGGESASGVSYQQGAARSDLGLIFAGQGSQAPGMLRDLMLDFPEALEPLKAAADVLRQAEPDGPALMDLIYPPQAFGDEKAQQQKALTATRYAQLALGAVGAAVLAILDRFKVKAAQVAGHSYGELLALYAAGVLKLEDMLKASYQRGRLMEEVGREGGGMLAVMASAEIVEKILVQESFEARIANYNAPEQVVVGGSTLELERLQNLLRSQRVTSKKLEVATAFHTPYVSDAAQKFAAWLREFVSLEAAKIPVFSNQLAASYPEAADEKNAALSEQLGSPVRFEAMLRAMREAAPAQWVEVGPGRKLLGLLKAVQPEALSLDSENTGSTRGLLALIAELAARGVPLDLKAWHPGAEELPAAKKKTFTVTLTGANYRAERSPKPAEAVQAGAKSAVAASATASHAATKSPRSADIAAAEAPRAAGLTAAAGTAAQPAATAPRTVAKTSSISTSSTPKSEESMPPKTSQEWSQLESLLQSMQEAQKKTTDAHTLFLENQRQFQQILREALLGGSPAQWNTTAQPASAANNTASHAAPASAFHNAASHAAPASVFHNAASHAAAPASLAQPASAYTASHAAPAQPAHQKPADAAPSHPTATQPANSFFAPARSAAQAASPAAAAAQSAPANTQEILKIVSDATGFPVEMLNGDMHLESDLGIDSIKKVEIFSQVQAAHPGLQADASRMKETQTIADLFAYVQSHDTASAPKAAASKEAEATEDRQGAWSASPVAFVSTRTQDSAEIRTKVLTVISEKTGFPTDMLQDEMDLEADLGVDSIKKVEIVSSLQEQFPGVPFAANALAEIHRIADILAHLQGGEESARTPQGATLHSVPDDAPLGDEYAREILWDVIAEKTGYPAEVLTPSMDLESDLGIDSIKRVEIVAALTEKLPRLKEQPITEVRTLEDLLHLLKGPAPLPNEEGLAASLLHPETFDWDLSAKKKSPEPEPEALVPEVKPSSAHVSCWKLKAVPWAPGHERYELKAQGEIWIVDDGSNLARNLMLRLQERGCNPKLVSQTSAERLTIPDHLQGLFLISPVRFDQLPLRWLQNAYKLLRRCAEPLLANEGFVVTISRHGGQFGLDGLNNIQQVYAGGAAAFVKTIAHEWPGVHVRAIDMGKDFTDSVEAVHRCIEGSFLKGPVELGVARERYYTLKLETEAFADEEPTKALQSGDTVLVTGGARGVTAATLIALAKRYPVRFVIWGRTALEAAEGPETRDLTDAAAIKKQLLFNHPELAHPRDLEKAYKNLLSQRELQSTFAALRSYGAEVVYEVVDVSREADVRRAVASLEERYRTIAGVIHGAGVIRDKLIVDQNEEELADVLDTKLRILPSLEALAQKGTKWMVFFSSSTARLGRKGQGAYGLANEVLNRMAAYISSQYPCRALSLNWGPWDGGMVNDGLKKLFASEGLGTIPLASGAAVQTFLLEHASRGSGEWLVLGEGGEEILKGLIINPEAILEKRLLSLSTTPILIDHVIKNRAVVPAALIAEWLSAAAEPLFPGLVLQEIGAFQVWKGLVLDVGTEIPLEIVLSNQSTDSAECILRSRTAEGQIRLHAHAKLTFAPAKAQGAAQAIPEDHDLAIKLYPDLLFHGETLHLLDHVIEQDERHLLVKLDPRGSPQDWDEALVAWRAEAPLLDAVFQAAIVWSRLEKKIPCLPSKFAAARYYEGAGAPPAYLELTLTGGGDHRLVADAVIRDAQGHAILRVEGFEATLDASLSEAFAGRDLFGQDAGL